MATGVKLIDLIYGVRAESGQSLKEQHGTSQRDTIVYLLQSVQRRLWTAHDWPLYVIWAPLDIPSGTRYINYPDDIDPSRVNFIERYWDAKYVRLKYGIGAEHYGQWDPDLNERNDPLRRWGHHHQPGMQAGQLGQIELWPVPATDTKIRVRGHQRLPEMLEDEDLSTLDGDMLVLYVAARLLARSNKADAELKLREADNIRRYILSQTGSDRDDVIQYGGSSRPRQPPRQGLDYINRTPGQGT